MPEFKEASQKPLLFAFFVLGLSSLIAQALIIRELIITFHGNELFSSLTLGFWLALVGIGSLFLARTFQKLNSLKVVLSAQLLIAIFLPLEIFFIRMIKNLFTLPGQLPNLLPALFYTFLTLAPLCLVLGLFWTIASKLYVRLVKQLSSGLTRVYILETIGFIIGGLVFSFLLITLNDFLVIFIVIILNLFSALLLTLFSRQRIFLFKFLIYLLLFFSFFLFLSPLSGKLQTKFLSLRFRNQELIESANSKYGNIAVTASGPQFNFYQNGLLLGSNRETYFNEELVHLSLLQSSHPKKILLIGHGFNGALNEILKHPVEQVYYLEMDSKLVSVAEKYLPASLAEDLKDPRVKIIYQDARAFIKKCGEGFDVIILNMGDPSSLLLNRFYTKEFFADLRETLVPDGLVATYLASAPNYISEELENLNASIYKALKQNFDYVIVLPENINLFLAAPQDILTEQPQEIINRFENRELKTSFITDEWLAYRLTNDRAESIRTLLRQNKEARVNSDFLPSAYLYNLFFWLKQFHPSSVGFLAGCGKTSPFWFLLVLFLVLLFWRRKTTAVRFLPFVTAIPDFTLLGLEILFIFSFQIFYGYIYHFIALLITSVMIGMLLGNWWALGKIKKAKVKIGSLIKVYLSMTLLCLGFLLSLKFRSNLWLAIPLLAGIVVGIDFPLTNSIFLAGQTHPSKKTGIIYAADLIGSCLGAVLVPLYLVPFFGVWQTLWFLIGLNILAAIFLRKLRP